MLKNTLRGEDKTTSKVYVDYNLSELRTSTDYLLKPFVPKRIANSYFQDLQHTHTHIHTGKMLCTYLQSRLQGGNGTGNSVGGRHSLIGLQIPPSLLHLLLPEGESHAAE